MAEQLPYMTFNDLQKIYYEGCFYKSIGRISYTANKALTSIP